MTEEPSSDSSGSPDAAAPRPARTSSASSNGRAHGRRVADPAIWRSLVNRGVVGVAVLVVLALVCVGLIVAVLVKTRDDAAQAAREAARYTPPPLTSSSAPATSTTVAIIGDESASRAASGVPTSRRWPALLGAALDAEVDLQASAGAGYATNGGGSTFVEDAERVPSTARYVVFVGGAADDAVSSLSLAKAATQAFAAAAEQAPEATIVAVGPLFQPEGTNQADIDGVRSALRSAARIADVRWVDPIESEWISSVAEAGDLSAVQERTIAARLRTAVESAAD